MTGPRLPEKQKLTILQRTREPDSFVMYCEQHACAWVGETNAVRDPTCPNCGSRSLRVWRSRT